MKDEFIVDLKLRLALSLSSLIGQVDSELAEAIRIANCLIDFPKDRELKLQFSRLFYRCLKAAGYYAAIQKTFTCYRLLTCIPDELRSSELDESSKDILRFELERAARCLGVSVPAEIGF